jgi:hypothetical protein
MTNIVAARPKSASMDSMRTNPAHAIIAPMRFGNNFENVRTVIDTLMPATGIAMADILFLTSSLNHLIRLGS